MRDSRYRMREFRSDDFEAQARLQNRLTPDRPVTVERLRFEDELAHRPPMVCRQVAVEEVASGVLVATGGLVTPPDAIGTDTYWTGAGVDPDHQGRGIGRDLADALGEIATELGAVRLWASTRGDDPRALRFLREQRFVEQRRARESALDVEAAVGHDAGPAEGHGPAGVVFTTVAGEGADDPRVIDRVHALAAATMGDAPRLGPYVPPSRQQVVDMLLSGSEYLPEAVFLARAGDRYVGISNLARLEAEPQVLNQIYTATLPEFRRRGVATELKRQGVRFAHEHGYRLIRTWNDSRNEAIWSLNERLGYRRVREMVLTEKVLVGPIPPVPRQERSTV